MDGVDGEMGFAKVWSSQGPTSILGLTTTMVSYGV